MSSFAMTMLEDGVDVDIAIDFNKMPSILDEEVARYSCGDFAYHIRPGKGIIGRLWIFIISVYDTTQARQDLISLGRLEMGPTDAGNMTMRVPPRSEQEAPEGDELDPDGKLFSSFIFQLLNSLRERKVIDLPGVLPTV